MFGAITLGTSIIAYSLKFPFQPQRATLTPSITLNPCARSIARTHTPMVAPNPPVNSTNANARVITSASAKLNGERTDPTSYNTHKPCVAYKDGCIDGITRCGSEDPVQMLVPRMGNAFVGILRILKAWCCPGNVPLIEKSLPTIHHQSLLIVGNSCTEEKRRMAPDMDHEPLSAV